MNGWKGMGCLVIYTVISEGGEGQRIICLC